jgi:hypothetical protein
LLALSALPWAACGGSSSHAAVRVKAIPANAVPAQLLDLTVKQEESAQARKIERPFVDGASLYSLRKGDLLNATLQVSHFSPTADVNEVKFRNAVVGQIGSTVPKPFRMSGQTVYLTTGRRQAVAVWFRDRYLFILSTREDYKSPRGLLRQALDIKP